MQPVWEALSVQTLERMSPRGEASTKASAPWPWPPARLPSTKTALTPPLRCPHCPCSPPRQSAADQAGPPAQIHPPLAPAPAAVAAVAAAVEDALDGVHPPCFEGQLEAQAAPAAVGPGLGYHVPGLPAAAAAAAAAAVWSHRAHCPGPSHPPQSRARGGASFAVAAAPAPAPAAAADAHAIPASL
eukprot:1161921-Pelagomonas_calceolata.AAC.6